jgi:hypothetical protein
MQFTTAELTRIYNLLIADASKFRTSALAASDRSDATLLNSYAEFREVLAAEILAGRENPETVDLSSELVLVGNLLNLSDDSADAELAGQVSATIMENDVRVLAAFRDILGELGSAPVGG